jgi:phage shock protein C
MRPREGRFIAGVCAALALEYGWDVPVVRLISALALLVSFGTVALVYFIAWVVIPEAPYALPSRGTGTAV